MRLQHPMFLAEVPAAEGAVADDALGGLFAGCERAAEFLGGHGGEGEVGERERSGVEKIQGRRGICWSVLLVGCVG